MKIIQYEDIYRDDMIFMILEAKNALGRIPGLNPDLLDIKKNYLNTGGKFWLAIDENNRVIGSIGYTPSTHTEACLHRLFVKYNLKRMGIGTKLLKTAEQHALENNKTLIKIHLGTPRTQWLESYQFYKKNGYTEYAENYMQKQLNTIQSK